LKPLACLLLACLSTACVGEIVGDLRDSVPAPRADAGVSVQSACTSQRVPGPSPIRRMTHAEYENTVRDLLGDATHPAADFGAEEEALGFNNNAIALTTSSALVEKQLAAAEGIAARVTDRLASLAWYTCAQAIEGDDGCARRFIDAFGPRAWRRPLTSEERDELFSLYSRGKAIGGVDANNVALSPFAAGLQLVITAALLSPDFLYRVEATGEAGVVPVSDLELASRLSYLIWGSMPDDALLDAATRGELHTAAQVTSQAERLLADPKARATVIDFHQQWLDFDRIHNVGKAQQVFPSWSPGVAALMETETREFIEHVVFDQEGTWDALMTAPYTYLNEPLASFYGVAWPGGSGDLAFRKVALDPLQRSGLLTQGTLLTINAHSNQTSPVHRGKLVREAFLCQLLPAPPANVQINVPEPDPGSTARERFAQHSSNIACSGCHQLMDPLGFGFENFDGVGKWRTHENGKRIDASGEVLVSDVTGPFDGAGGLGRRLLGSRQAQRCYVQQWFRFGAGRGEMALDACSLERLDETFQAQGHDVKKLILSLTQTDAFLYRSGP
jgi:hypothetical protein